MIHFNSSVNHVQSYQIQSEQQAVDPIITRIYDSYIQVPVQASTAAPRQAQTLLSRIDTILSPNHPSCGVPTHTPQTCNCRQQQQPKNNNIYTLPITYQSRYDQEYNNEPDTEQDTDQSGSQPQFLPESSDEVNYPEYPEPDYHRNFRISKREVNSPIDILKQFNLKPKKSKKKLRNRRRETSPFKQLRLSLFQKPLFQETPLLQNPSIDLSKVRNKRIPEQSSPCAYSYQSCDPSKHTKEGCSGCYKCKCEPVEPNLSQSSPNQNQQISPLNPEMKIPYKVFGMDETANNEPTKIVIQEFSNEAPGYTGLDQDMYRKYIRQILNKYPLHAANSPNNKGMTQDLMSFIGELATTDTSDQRFRETTSGKYALIDNAVDFYKFYQGALQNKMNPGVLGDIKPFQKRGTVLEVIELDPSQVERFQDFIKK